MNTRLLTFTLCTVLATMLTSAIAWATCPSGCPNTVATQPAPCSNVTTCSGEAAILNDNNQWYCPPAQNVNSLDSACPKIPNSCSTCASGREACSQATSCVAQSVNPPQNGGAGYICVSGSGYGNWSYASGDSSSPCSQ